MPVPFAFLTGLALVASGTAHLTTPPPAPESCSYSQVQFAFLAGLALVLLLIPVNRVLANRIQAASLKMMGAKDRWALLAGWGC